jgi:two-component system, response regulator PdtaR
MRYVHLAFGDGLGVYEMPRCGLETAPRLGAPRILVVEDEPLIRFAIAEALRELGVSVVEAASAEEAWRYLMSGESVDLVFTDHRMPGSMTGAQLAIRIRREYPSLVVIVTSAYFDDQGWSEPVVAKPYNLDEIAAALTQQARDRQQRDGDL